MYTYCVLSIYFFFSSSSSLSHILCALAWLSCVVSCEFWGLLDGRARMVCVVLCGCGRVEKIAKFERCVSIDFAYTICDEPWPNLSWYPIFRSTECRYAWLSRNCRGVVLANKWWICDERRRICQFIDFYFIFGFVVVAGGFRLIRDILQVTMKNKIVMWYVAIMGLRYRIFCGFYFFLSTKNSQFLHNKILFLLQNTFLMVSR